MSWRTRRTGAVVAGVIPALVLSVTAASAAGRPAGAGQEGERVSVVVRLADGVSAAQADDVARDHGADLRFVYEHALEGFSAQVPEGRVNGLEHDRRVAYVERDRVVRTAAQTIPTGIARIGADANPAIDIDGNDDVRVDVDVAIIDTGIDAGHPDLNVVGGTDCARKGPFNTSCRDGSFTDGNAHGTHVAGTVAALDNGLGVVGVAPGARLYGVKVLNDRGSGYTSWIVAGIDWVTARAGTIEVANMSLGMSGFSQAIDDAISGSVDAGIAYAVAAGNDASDASGSTPASNPDALTVSALADSDGAPGGTWSGSCRDDQEDTLADFSNFGSVIDIAAPGVCILSTVPGGGYAEYSGTSMASPHVAGAAALLASNGLSPAQIRSQLLSSGTSDWTDESGDGAQEPLLNVSGISPTTS